MSSEPAQPRADREQGGPHRGLCKGTLQVTYYVYQHRPGLQAKASGVI